MKNMREKLKEKILSFGGDVVHITHPNKDVKKWVDRGVASDGKDSTVENGRAGFCEEESLDYYLKHKDEGVKLCKGFALNKNHGMWVYHAWCKDKDGVIHECTSVKRDLYYGIELDEKESEKFRRSVDFEYDAECARKEKQISANDVGRCGYKGFEQYGPQSELAQFFKRVVEQCSKGEDTRDDKSSDNAKSL